MSVVSGKGDAHSAEQTEETEPEIENKAEDSDDEEEEEKGEYMTTKAKVVPAL